MLHRSLTYRATARHGAKGPSTAACMCNKAQVQGPLLLYPRAVPDVRMRPHHTRYVGRDVSAAPALISLPTLPPGHRGNADPFRTALRVSRAVLPFRRILTSHPDANGRRRKTSPQVGRHLRG